MFGIVEGKGTILTFKAKKYFSEKKKVFCSIVYKKKLSKMCFQEKLEILASGFSCSQKAEATENMPLMSSGKASC